MIRRQIIWFWSAETEITIYLKSQWKEIKERNSETEEEFFMCCRIFQGHLWEGAVTPSWDREAWSRRKQRSAELPLCLFYGRHLFVDSVMRLTWFSWGAVQAVSVPLSGDFQLLSYNLLLFITCFFSFWEFFSQEPLKFSIYTEHIWNNNTLCLFDSVFI